MNKRKFITKDKLKSIINTHVGYAEQEIYDALEEVYTEEQVKHIVLMAMQEAHERYGYPHEYYEEWFEQNKKK